jgi:sodium transport system permease protein
MIQSPGELTTSWTVFRKELVDALRDRRTLLTVFLSSVAVGPLILFVVSALIGNMERRSEDRVMMMVGAESAPTLVNHLERMNISIKAAPADYRELLVNSKLGDPVVVVPSEFEAQLAQGEVPTIEVFSSASNQRAELGARRAMQALLGFGQELASQRLIAHGVTPMVLKVVDVEERDVANPQARAAQLTGMVPFFVLMAVLYGAMTAALDTTAGERERGSLEPLLMNPTSRASLVVGKWAAVVSVSMAIALLSCLSFLPAQVVLRSESLAAMFQFGWSEVVWFLLLLAPLAAALSAVMMAIAIRTKSFKEAQTNNTVVIMAMSLLPLVVFFNQEGEAPWHLWVPAIGQITLMNRVLKGDAIPGVDVAIVVAVGAVITVVALGYVARSLRRAAVR